MFQKVLKYCTDRNIELVAVTKTRPVVRIMQFYELGHRVFGENRVQELREKYDAMPKDIQWHMIGHLQSNKVKYIAEFVSMIHSGASHSLLKEIDKRARSHQRNIDVLLQIKIGQEEAKSGWSLNQLIDELKEGKIQDLSNLNIRGVMGMTTFTADEDTIRNEFSTLKKSFDQIKDVFYSDQDSFDTVSMGMSGDYKIAIEEGSTMVRIGSLLYQ